MKVVCESCQAKYQVPDERVAGKKLKIRCKRCGATVLIRGDLVADTYGRPAASRELHEVKEPATALEPVAPSLNDFDNFEWHVSLDGDTRGPFDSEGIRNWLNTTPGGWDAHVWREGFPDWIEARACAELEPPPAAPAVTSLQEDELPTQTFQAQSIEGAAFMADLASSRGMRSTQVGQPSALRSRTPNGIETTPAPRMTTSQPYEVGHQGRHEESVLFSQPNLQTMTGSSSYGTGSSPGFASGEGSGLIDIRALASLARQGTTQIARAATGARGAKLAGGGRGVDPSLSFGLDDDARGGQQGGLAHVDSLAPVSNAPQTSNVALPLAIVGGCALVAAAVFAAILFSRPPRAADLAKMGGAAIGQVRDAIGAVAQPAAEDQGPPESSDADLNAQEREAAKAMPGEPESRAEPGSASDDELAAGKAKRQSSHIPHQVVEEKKAPTTPEEKAKQPKKEDKPEPPASTGETMLADRAKPVKQPGALEPKSEPSAPAASQTSTNSGGDIDSALAAKQGKPAPAKGLRSMDDLLVGADKGTAAATAAKPAAPTAAATPAPSTSSDLTAGLPDSPSRDETLAAMRGVESAVRACNVGPEALTGTAEVALTVAGSTGRVTTANVSGITGNIGSCIARAVRNARFPRFGKPTFSIKYPFRF